MADTPWPTIHAERRALADDLANVSDEQWQTPSLCSGWTVHQLLGHVVATAKMTPPAFFGHFVGAGFNFDKMSQRRVDAETAGGPAATLAELRANVDSTKSPPGPVDSWLGETLVHSADIRKPLGLAHTYPSEALTRTLDFYKKSNLIVGAKKRIAGLTLRATDVEWSTGEGPVVEGPAMSLLLAMTGRSAALDDLSGEGVAVLRGR
jgi:uncharacterized protein (TIGR03083 family)